MGQLNVYLFGRYGPMAHKGQAKVSESVLDAMTTFLLHVGESFVFVVVIPEVVIVVLVSSILIDFFLSRLCCIRRAFMFFIFLRPFASLPMYLITFIWSYRSLSVLSVFCFFFLEVSRHPLERRYRLYWPLDYKNIVVRRPTVAAQRRPRDADASTYSLYASVLKPSGKRGVDSVLCIAEGRESRRRKG